MTMHPLTAHIIEKRAELAAYEAQKRPARDAIMRMSIYLGGLEKAARLCGIPIMERRAKATPGYREIMANIELDDFYDPWGVAMGWIFGIAEAAWYVDGHIMPHFRPSPIPTSREKVMDDHASAMIVRLYESGAITMQDMANAYNVMDRYASWCKLAGRDY